MVEKIRFACEHCDKPLVMTWTVQKSGYVDRGTVRCPACGRGNYLPFLFGEPTDLVMDEA
jgi:hypothetical protein